MFIYGIKNKLFDKIVYVGQTVRPILDRFNQHLRDSRILEYPLYRAIRKYDEDNFEVLLLAVASNLEELDILEIQYTNQYDTLVPNGYNLMLGRKGGRQSPETVEKIRQKSIENGFGKWERTEEHNQKNRERAILQHTDPISKERFLIANGSKYFDVYEAIQLQTRAPGRPSLYAKGSFVGNWLSSIHCAKDLNIKPGHIRGCLLGQRKSHEGYIFEYSIDKNK